MIALGIDSVEIERFKPWTSYSHKKLRTIFAEQELAYCFANTHKTAERLAVRFAAREAFFKAVHQLLPALNIPLRTIARAVNVVRASNGVPSLSINWNALKLYVDIQDSTHIETQLALTHTKTVATAVVLAWFRPAENRDKEAL